jgi:hypothetical protein
MSFTPGPWAWDSRNGKDYLVSLAADTPHAIVLGWPTGLQDGTRFTDDAYGQADARLVAAAPDLYAALQAVLALYGPSSEYGYEARIVWQQAERAILKADQG